MEATKQYSVIGKRVARVDAREKALGEAKYIDDITLPGMLYAAVLGSPHAHGRILSIDTSQAEKLPGVKAVITGKDIPDRKFCILSGAFPGLDDKLPLEKEKVRYIGDDVAAVAAVDLETAERALELIDVTYEVLPPVLDPEQAMQPGIPRIHDDKEGNISVKVCYDFGDVDKSFKEADYVFEDRFRTSQQAHCCMETHSCIARWGDDGRLTLWSSTQVASVYQRELSKVLGIPFGDVRVIKTTVGGSFGGKMSMHTIEPIAAYLAKKTGRPVKLVYSRDEEFVCSRTRHPAVLDIRTAVKKDGTIIGREVDVFLDDGAYNAEGPGVLHELGASLCSYYRAPNARVNGYLVYTNKPWGGAFRGFGNPQAAFPIESQMDIIASKLNIDPVEIRLKNANKTGDVTACGWEISSCGLAECIEKAAKAVGWKDKRGRGDNRGVGIASCIHWGGGLSTGASTFCTTIVEVGSTGQVLVYTGESELGEGADTVVAQVIAEELGVPLKTVKLAPLDTDTCPSFFFVGSPTTYAAGGAAKAAAADAKRQILEAAAEMKSLSVNDLDTADGYIHDKRSGEKIMLVSEATYFSYEVKGISIVGKGRFDQGPSVCDFVTGAGQLSPTYCFAAQAVEVEVDPETGVVKILNFASAHDSGEIINPTMAEGQIEGGIAHGLGYALTEGLVYNDDGKALNASFTDYKVFRAQDMPGKVDTILVKTVDSKGPFGAKALGEVVMVTTAPAIANAIEDATGVRITELPITPEKILKALRER